MKKILGKIILGTALTYVGMVGVSSNVNAISVAPDEVPNQTYIIGTHMFTRDKNANYPGYITTKSIMLAAQTIEGDALSDMKVYYKTARGAWVNGLTNQGIDEPEDFDVRWQNLLQVCNPDANTIQDAGCMQDMNNNIADSMEEGLYYNLRDTRDDKVYQIVKLADGNVWMTQNLALGDEDESLTLTSLDSDVEYSFILQNSYTEWDCNNEKACSEIRFHESSSSEYGNYYSWYTATANSGTYSTNNGENADSSICPKGWRLPTGGDNYGVNEYYALARTYNTSGIATKMNRRIYNVFKVVNSGEYCPQCGGTDENYIRRYSSLSGGLWTSTKGENEFSYSFTYYYGSRLFEEEAYSDSYHSGNASYIDAPSSWGLSVRCVAR